MINVQIFRTNVILAAFTNYIQHEKAAKTTLVQKICTLNVDEIDNRRRRTVEIIFLTHFEGQLQTVHVKDESHRVSLVYLSCGFTC